ncbi:hypothetical protein ENC_28210 [Enterobacter hormaechei]|uniref:hypothetical protein n=1 Tax=Enterobacter hormaechei TaxID=158836 RepID=UPI0001CD2AD8|nr:hypothetical protein [Enterobacter hormaechei]MCE1447717.1 hypothetical protein [Enterobacter hormaechei]MCE1456454.1 hypothetical protein [Enterobacter hormaechei]CBK86279.1 hypothetical protein ENC_28210 [Enterobacter hormaechei]
MRISSRSTPFERIEYVLILSVLMLLVVVTLQPILNLVAISFSSPANVPGMSGLEIIPQGFSLDVWKLLLTNEAVLRGFGNAMLITVVGTIINVVFTVLLAWGWRKNACRDAAGCLCLSCSPSSLSRASSPIFW